MGFQSKPCNSLVLSIILTVFFCLCLLDSINCQSSSGSSSNSTCVSKKTCGECIRSAECVWCAQPIFNNAGDLPLDRCNTPTTHMAHPINIRCAEHFLINPSNEVHYLEDESISTGSDYQRVVQIQPQRIALKLRVGQAYNLKLKYSQAEDYPVDLYYLMDLSKSMEDDKETLSKLGGQLAEAMQRMTSKFKLGFGSFVDKVVMPFVSTVEKKLLEPCENCVRPYGFKNHLKLNDNSSKFQPCPGCEAPYGYQNVMSLDQDTTRFAGEVEKARVSGNLDAPEGGFDAVMQAIVCDSIGWRKEARRLLVFSTDASFHYAGDGKLGGIVKPNDGQCHMESRGEYSEYTHSTLQDYPSVAQINSKVKEKSIHMIFAVTAEQVNIYQKLTKSIQGSSCGELEANSSNVVELVQQEYQKITSTVELKDTSSEFIRVSYFSTCLSNDANDLIERNKCSDLRVGSIVDFLVKIELVKCPTNPAAWKDFFEIYAVGLNERLTVDLEMLCQCACERPENVVPYSVHCGYHGTESCGICDCDVNYFGKNCECNTTSGSQIDDDRACRLDNTTDIVCSNRGQCVCGQCQCDRRDDPKEIISGPFCQCDNFSCERENTLLCSGEDHGKCECGKCVCEPEWEGPACQCPVNPLLCRAPDSDKICDGHGRCECGRCVCDITETERYSGKYCNRCPGCPDKCEFLKDCIQCFVHETGDFAENEAKCSRKCLEVGLIYQENHSKHKIEIVDIATSDEAIDEIYCSATDKTDDCRFYYVYGYNASRNNELYVRAQETKDCPPKPPIMWIIFGVVGAIVLVGLVFLLLWKLLTHIHDRAEYARFEKERMNAKWDAGENPIYKQATSTFKNPMYAGR